MATLEYALAKAPSGAVIYPEQLPTQMAWTLFGQLSQVQNALAPVVREVSGKNFQWTAWPTGTVNNFLIFDEQGQLEQATVMGISSYPLSRPWDCLLTARGMRLPLPATAYAIPLLIQIPYFASAPVKLAVTFGGHHYTVTLAASKLADGYLPVEGPGNVVLITPLTANPKVCISGVTVGTVQVSDRATPIPLFPLPG